MQKRRLKQAIKTVDFPLMLQEIVNHGYSIEDIVDLTETDKLTLKRAVAEITPSAWNQAIKIADMYLRITNKTTLPFI